MSTKTTSQLKERLWQELDHYDHPMLNRKSLIDCNTESCLFLLEDSAVANQMSDFLNEFGLLTQYHDNRLAIFFDRGWPDFSVLNTRRAYFFEGLIFAG